MVFTKGFRLFVLDGRIMLTTPYWEEGEYEGDAHLPLDMLHEIVPKVQSRFFTLDVAKCVDGSWTIVEPGDGQVAGLPERADVEAFYLALAASK